MDIANEMGLNARSKIEKDHTIEKMCEQNEKLYHRIIKQ